jgi:hypothetical protein
MARIVQLEDFLDKGRILKSLSSKRGRRYEASYDDEEEMLFITFIGGGAKMYGYYPVNEIEARGYFFAPSKGKWIWSNLRVRGSATLHQKKYWLMG